jgi:hypothetical protein
MLQLCGAPNIWWDARSNQRHAHSRDILFHFGSNVSIASQHVKAFLSIRVFKHCRYPIFAQTQPFAQRQQQMWQLHHNSQQRDPYKHSTQLNFNHHQLH